jgi:hypothetical protein
MLEKVRQMGMLKFAGDQKACDVFVESFAGHLKEAGMLDGMLNLPTGQSSSANQARQADTAAHAITKGLSTSLGQGLGGLVMSLGTTTAGTLYNTVRNQALHSKFLQALERAYRNNRILTESPKEKVLQYAETIFKFAPNVATDSNLLTSILTNAIHGDGIDPMTIKTLTELEGRFTDNTTFNPKSYS